MAAALTELRAAVRQTVLTEFTTEAFEVRNDKLHESLGTERAIAAVFPEGERPHSSGIVGTFLVTVQVFMRWDPQINPAQIVDPALIESWSWRLQRRIRSESRVNSANISYYVVNEVLYPDDPTGNKTRFVMGIVGYGPNAALAESTA